MQLNHDPDARLDYYWNWTEWLKEGETIVDFNISFTPPQDADGLTEDDSDIYVGGKQVVAWLTGGEVNTAVGVTCHIKTSEDREDDRTLDIWVEER